jgi:hypothetical protein
VDGLGQTGSDRSGEHADGSVPGGRSASWPQETRSSAGAALEAHFEPLNSWNGPPADRRGIEALIGNDPTPPARGADPLDDPLTSTLVQPLQPLQPSFTPFPFSSADEDPYADELAQRSADFALNSGFDDPTPPQGLPLITPPVASAPPLSLGQRFGLAFPDDELHTSAPTAFHGFPSDAPTHFRGDGHAVHDARPADLPRRNPGESEVPPSDSAPVVPPIEDKMQLKRIASHLRRDDVPEDRPDGFDVDAVLRAVRSVAGVREATLRTTPVGAHHLRLELAEGADPGTISRMVARMLEEQMGLDAAPTSPAGEGASGSPPVVLPTPRPAAGAADKPHLTPVPEARRRHPVGVPRRPADELRPSERAAAAWKAAIEPDQPGSPPPPIPTDREQGPRAIIEHVQTSTFGLDATVEVRLAAGDRIASGVASGPAVDGYVLRLCAAATAAAVDDLFGAGTTTGETARCFVEHAALVPMGSCDVAVVVVLLVCGGWVEQLAGSALVSGDPRRAVVRATLSAVNRRLAALLP